MEDKEQTTSSMEIQVISSMEVQVVNKENKIISTEIQVVPSTEIQVMDEEDAIFSTEIQESLRKNLPDHLSSSTDEAIILLIIGDQIDKKIYVIRAATVNDRIHTSTEVNECCFPLLAFKHGFYLPCCEFIVNLLKYLDVAPSQLAIGAWVYVSAFVVRCRDVGVIPSLTSFAILFSSSIAANFMVSFSQRKKGTKLFGSMQSKFSGGKDSYFFVTSTIGWKFRTTWNTTSSIRRFNNVSKLLKNPNEDKLNKLLAWDNLQASPPPIAYLDSRRQALRCDTSGAFLDFTSPSPSQLAIENAVNNPDEPIDNSQDDLGGNDSARDDVNIDTLQDVAPHPKKRHFSDLSREDETQQLVPSIVLAVPCTRSIFRQKALLSPITEVTHDEEEAYSSSTHDAFLEEPSSIGMESSSFIGLSTSSSSIDSVLTSTLVPNDTPSVPSSLPILVSPQIIISTTITNTSNELPKVLASASQLSSSCASALAATMSISHELPHMSLPLPPLSSLCTIASSTTLSTLSEPLIMPPSSSLCAIASSSTLRTSSESPIIPRSLPPLTSLSMTSPLMTSENIISSLVSTYPSPYVPLIVTSTQSTVISTPMAMLGSLVTCIPDVSTTFPRALLTQSLSTVTIPSIMSSSIIPSLSSSSAGIFSSSTFAKAISEAMSVVAMTRDVHSDEVSEVDRLRRRLGEAALHSVTSFMDFKCYSNKIEASLVASKKREADLRAYVLTLETSIKEMKEEKIHRDNEIESLRQKVFKLESDTKQDEGDKDAKISSLERALARVRAFVALSVEDLGNNLEPSNNP